MHLYRRNGGRRRAVIASVLVFAAAMALTISLLNQTGARVEDEQFATLQKALRRASVTCYALEGRYPPNLAYLSERYGVMIDSERFMVRYEPFAPNIMPNIEISAIGGEGPDATHATNAVQAAQ